MSVLTEIPNDSIDMAAVTMNAVVKGKDSDGESWKEVADVVSFSATGAGFYVPTECKAGTLVSLMLPLPSEMRCYDHDKEFYRVWGLVQHCQAVMSEEDDVESYHVGVAFIGKNVPSGYHDDPTQNYRISGMTGDGLWKVEAVKNEFKHRRDARYWQPIECYLAVVDKDKMSRTGAKAVTENVSRSGAAVFSSLEVQVGDSVKFICEQFDFSGLAVVCNRQSGNDGRMRLHLQFVNSAFPVNSLSLVNVKEVVDPKPVKK